MGSAWKSMTVTHAQETQLSDLRLVIQSHTNMAEASVHSTNIYGVLAVC